MEKEKIEQEKAFEELQKRKTVVAYGSSPDEEKNVVIVRGNFIDAILAVRNLLELMANAQDLTLEEFLKLMIQAEADSNARLEEIAKKMMP